MIPKSENRFSGKIMLEKYGYQRPARTPAFCFLGQIPSSACGKNRFWRIFLWRNQSRSVKR
jgi:hypothetical protein